jgi:hypothetical protein
VEAVQDTDALAEEIMDEADAAGVRFSRDDTRTLARRDLAGMRALRRRIDATEYAL